MPFDARKLLVLVAGGPVVVRTLAATGVALNCASLQSGYVGSGADGDFHRLRSGRGDDAAYGGDIQWG